MKKKKTDNVILICNHILQTTVNDDGVKSIISYCMMVMCFLSNFNDELQPFRHEHEVDIQIKLLSK